MGWNNKNRPLTITFEFSQRQEFKSVTLNTFCQLDLGIQPFSQMLAYFSTDGLTYHQQYVKVVNKQLSISGQAQNITLSLAQRIGIPNNIRNKKIKVRFYKKTFKYFGVGKNLFQGGNFVQIFASTKFLCIFL